MDTHRSDDRFSQDFDGISRREALLVGSGGLAAAIFALRAMPVRAQEATPDTTGGMPEGVNVMPGVTVNVEDMPPRAGAGSRVPHNHRAGRHRPGLDVSVPRARRRGAGNAYLSGSGWARRCQARWHLDDDR
jgi:hypothetical protein